MVYPIILQVIGLKKYHDEDTRRDFYSLILSDGNVKEYNGGEEVPFLKLRLNS